MVRPGSVLEVGQLVGPVSGLQHAHAWVQEVRRYVYVRIEHNVHGD